jgi:hypothetical protein
MENINNNINNRNIQNPIYESDNIYSRLNSNSNSNSNNIYSQLNKNVKLPEGWIELVDEETNRKYYACTITKHTQWLHPCIPVGEMMPNGLPYGWDKDYDENGQVFYINHVGRFNSYKPPVKQRKYMGEDYVW